MIRVVDLSKSFGELKVLKAVSFEVSKGEVLAVIGPSGSGKSTLLRCIIGLEKVDSGEVWIEGERLGAGGNKSYEQRTKMGFIFQRFNLFGHLTALENIMLAPRLVKKANPTEAEKLARQVLAQVGLADKANSYPAQLSGGQQQRVAIARALAMDPKVLLMDEITSALDPELVNEVLEVVVSLAKKGMTMILVTHEMNFARNVASKVLFMDDGSIIESGAPVEIFDTPKHNRTRAFLGSVLSR